MGVVSRSREGLTRLLIRLQDVSTAWGLQINHKKTKAMLIDGTGHIPAPLNIPGGEIEFVDRFVYLGSTFTSSGTMDAEFQRRVGRAYGAIRDLQPLWSRRGVSRGIKVQALKALVPPALTYGCETWALSSRQSAKLEVVMHHGIRQALGVKPLDRVTNVDLRAQAKMDSMDTYARQQRLRYLGHTARAPQRLPHALLFGTHVPGLDSAAKHPASVHSVIDMFRNDLAVLAQRNPDMGVWYEEAQNRATWRGMVKDLSEVNS